MRHILDATKTWMLWMATLAGGSYVAPGVSWADDPDPQRALFTETVSAFLQNYCADCHGEEEPEGGLHLMSHLNPAGEIADREVWEKVLSVLEGAQMPPEDQAQPSAEEIQAVLGLAEAELAKFDCGDKIRAGRVTIRRLNRVEYNNTIRDLLGIDFQPAADFPSDDVGAGFDNIGDVLSISPILIEKYLDAATEIVDRAFQNEAARARIFVCDPDRAEGEEIADCYNQVVESFARRAFRRPVTPAEKERLLELGKSVWDRGGSEVQALQVVLQAVLASPHFLFRVEQDPPPTGTDAAVALNDFELASRLSYFLWSSMPDDELFELARQGSLHEPQVLRRQAARMLRDPKAEALVKNFAGQWLQLRDLAHLTPAQELFPEFDEPLRDAMLRETEMLFSRIVQEDRSILEFLNADYSFLNERLARHYGIDGVEGEQFRLVQLNERRRGVLTHGSILMLTANPTRTSPVKRGKWILENILDDPPPPPLPGVMQLEEQPELLGSLRERMEQHRADPTCAVCHKKMDALGFGLENFDAIGRWRDRDDRFEIDASGTLPGGLAFDGPQELMQILAETKKEDFCRCLAEKMLTYALGRELEAYDLCTRDAILKELAAHEYRFSSLINAIVTSVPFTMRGALGDDP